jgi:hypothetical protein
MNVTVTQPTAPGDLSVLAGNGTTSSTSNLNFTAGETVANLVIVPLHNGKRQRGHGPGSGRRVRLLHPHALT